MERFKKEILEWGQAILVTLAIFMVYNFFFATTTVYNTSMYPTLVEKDMLFLVKYGEVKHGDIVSFKSHLTLTARDYEGLNFIQKLIHKEGDRKNLIKRVIAGAGDTVEIKEGVVILNGEVLDEPYVNTVTTKELLIENIPEGKYFCMGDNRNVSYDSRDMGLVDEEDIIGKVAFRFMPINKIGGVN